MSPRLKPDTPNESGSHASEKPRPDPGTFRPDGSWNPDATSRTEVYYLVKDLCERRRRGLGLSPADFQELVRLSPFPDILGACGASWSEIRDVTKWREAWVSTSAASAIKFGGYDPNKVYWNDEGKLAPIKHRPLISGDELAKRADEMAAAFGAEAEVGET